MHHVEAAWNPSLEIDWSHSFELKGDRLLISGTPGIDPVSGDEVAYRMVFRRV